MAEPHWTSYVGMATGIIGSFTGIAGAIMGYVSYKRSNSLKSLDMRLELKKAVNNIQANLSQTGILIEKANESRIAVAAAKGMSGSGAMVKWKQNVQSDKEDLMKLFGSAPKLDEKYEDLPPKDLESELVKVHRLQAQVDELKKKYEAALEADADDRKHIREDARARFTR